MPTQSDGQLGSLFRSRFLLAGKRLRPGLGVLALGAICCFAPQQTSAERPTAAIAAQTVAEKTKPSPPAKPPNKKKWGKLEGNAAWYKVPLNSLAKRRAGKDELTAAHNRLPLGTLVSVTHLANGKKVIVRITDRGITDRRVLIDLCKEAAEKLGMIREGSARVRLEILPDDRQTSAPDSNSPAHP